MKYRSFRVKNFKGIKDAFIDLSSMTGANVFALVGLNESGKTTLLEALHSFSPDFRSGNLTGRSTQERSAYRDRVPRHLLSTFTGEISVEANISLTEADKASIADLLQSDYDPEFALKHDILPSDLTIKRSQVFERGDFKSSGLSIDFSFLVRRGKQRSWRAPSEKEQSDIVNSIYSHTPDIAYYPTFIFDFPEKVFLTHRGGLKNLFYRDMFKDILAFDGQGHDVDEDIVRRVQRDNLVGPWGAFVDRWRDHEDRRKIQHVIDRASSAVTRLVFGRWNRIFKEDVKGKEVIIEYDVVEGEVKDKAGNTSKTERHDIYVKFQIKDGTRRFDVNDRSLGFRWFFSFLLFTQFRVARQESRPVLFLFDEPASNLHAAAQEKLIESFPEIACGDNMLVYSTHSHHMIEPKWLEQTFIVTNQADTPTESVIDTASLDDEFLDIKAERYRSFANKHPGRTSYFQPIVDRLRVIPSRFDHNIPSLIVEGKSDYYILRYATELLSLGGPRIIPGLGAGTFDALVALGSGWGIKFLYLLDGDRKGRDEAERYALELGAPRKSIMTISDALPSCKEIEDLLDAEAMHIIQWTLQLSSKPSKTQITRFFQEHLARGSLVPLGRSFEERSKVLITAITNRFADVVN